MARRSSNSAVSRLIKSLGVFMLTVLAPLVASGQVSSVSAWNAADFRMWAYIPYWSSIPASGSYTHVSDVLYFGGLRPDANGNITPYQSSYQTNFNTLRSRAQTDGFNLHLSMFEVTNNQTDATWTALINSPTARANFVSQLKTIMQGDRSTGALKGFNFDWERPSSAALWGNYTQLARELRAAINPLGMEVSVCDFGSTASSWDDTALFDAKVYDQLMMMVYHIGATSSGNWANTKKALTGQGAAKAFSDDQIGIGVGTYGDGVDPDGSGPLSKPGSVTLAQIVAANPNLPYDATTYTGTIAGKTGTWNIESRKQVREKTQLALDRGMPGMFTWTLNNDPTNDLGLHRVMQHYAMVKRDIPDLNLNGKVDTTDATTLANNMGTSRTNTGMTAAAQFEAFYVAKNWENGDHDGNGFVNQVDADWLAGRYTALGVSLPDRLAYSGTFENHQSAVGIAGRWQAGRNAQNKLVETGNFTQNGANFLSWNGIGVGASMRANSFVTLRNQSATEVAAAVNSLPRSMSADLSTNIDLGQDQDAYVTFLVRENASALTAGQLAANNRTLSLDFLNASGGAQFNFALNGLQQQFAIDSVADAAGQDVAAGGFAANTTFLFIAKISGNGADANTMQASLFPTGAVVANFTDPNFQWMLTAQGSAGFNPVIADLRFTSLAGANFTVSNVWVGDAATILPATLTSQGDFNHDGIVNNADYVLWRNSAGQTGANLAADANGNFQIDDGDFNTWRAHFGEAVTASAAALASGAAVPEPSSLMLLLLSSGFFALTRSRR